jgi:hypothetical protein
MTNGKDPDRIVFYALIASTLAIAYLVFIGAV